MPYELSQDFQFDAAHTLTRAVPLVEFTPSTRIHGHTYHATVTVMGAKGSNGMLEFNPPAAKGVAALAALQPNKKTAKPITLDLFYLRQAIERVRGRIDHRFLDEVEGLGAPTLENLCEFIAQGVTDAGFPVSAITVRRSSGDACTWRP